MKYFDTRTGALVDYHEHKLAIENRLAQRYPIVPVEGAALEIIEAGREETGIDTEDLGSADELVTRPAALETQAEAKKNLEDEEKARVEARKANAGIEGGSDVDGDPTPVGEAGEQAAARKQESKKGASKK